MTIEPSKSSADLTFILEAIQHGDSKAADELLPLISTVTVFWQNVPGWGLQQNNDLTQPANWSDNNNWTSCNGTNYLNLTSPLGRKFFRVQHP